MGPHPIGLVSLEEEEVRTQSCPEGRPGVDSGRRLPAASQREASGGDNPADTLTFLASRV